MSKEWRVLISKGSDWYTAFRPAMEQRFRRDNPGEDLLARRMEIHRKLKGRIDFDDVLIVDDVVYENIAHDTSFLLEAANATKGYMNRMLDRVADDISKYSLKKTTRHELFANVEHALVEALGQVLDAGDQVLKAKMQSWKDAKNFKIQRRWKVGFSVLRVAGATTGGVLASVSAAALTPATLGVSLAGLVFAWYGAIRTGIAAVDEVTQAYMGIYQLMAEADRMLAQPIDESKTRAVRSGVMRGIAGMSIVDTLQKVLAHIDQVRLKLPVYKEKEAKLGKAINDLLDKQEELRQAISKQERLEIGTRLGPGNESLISSLPSLADLDDNGEGPANPPAARSRRGGDHHLRGELLARLDAQLQENEGRIDALIVKHVGAGKEEVRGSAFIERWIRERAAFVSQHNRVGGKLLRLENAVSNGISLALNSASAGTLAGIASGMSPLSPVDIAGLTVTASFDLEPLALLVKEYADQFGDD